MDNLWQSWENVLDYIKLEMGAYVLDLELSDDEIIEIIKQHTLPLFSRYSPLIRYYYVTDEDNLIRTEPTYVYQIKNFDYRILKILEIIAKPDILDYNQNIAATLYSGDITNLLGQNYMLQSKSTVLATDSYEFFPPDKIELIKSSNSLWISRDFVVKFECIHNSPSTIHGDLYDYFKQLATADIMRAVARIRTKYQSFATPVGQVDLTAQELLQEAKEIRREVIDTLDKMPPDKYLWIM